MQRQSLLAAILLALCSLTLRAQTPLPAQPEFEAVSIHMVDSSPHSIEDLQKGIGMFSISPFPTNLFTAKNASLKLLIQIAYSVDNQHQILAKPDWMESQEYDVSAKVEGDRQLTLEQMRPMLQHLLEQRFHLQTHREASMSSGFALVVAKGGPKLKIGKEGQPHFQLLPYVLQGVHSSTKDLTGALALAVHQPVVDKTDLTGIYDIDLSFAPANDPNSSLPDIFTAIQEQLGLKLVPQKVPVEMLVIDHADKIPTEN